MGPDDTRRLLRWQRKRGRAFPWRQSSDPYRVAITELMLVRTRADQVARIWEGFFRRFPDPQSLADAPDADVMEALRGLGLKWRARLIKDLGSAAARNGGMPLSTDGLPGMGPYVAGAMRMALRGRGRVPIDVTLARVIARYYGLRVNGEARRDARVLRAAAGLGIRSRRFFHALLDVAALICLPREPNCRQCPLRKHCAFYAVVSAATLAKTSSSSL